MPFHLARQLDPIEIRVLGSLVEKEMSTPEYYPLTLNALVAACNQKSNRDPVMELRDAELQSALDRLQDQHLVWRVMGGRVERWQHNLDKKWEILPESKAILALLLLRGPQTSGELRGRSERLFTFESVAQVEQQLQSMSEGEEPLVRQLPRRPGQKESRWVHLACAFKEEATAKDLSVAPKWESLDERLVEIETTLAKLTNELSELKKKLGEA